MQGLAGAEIAVVDSDDSVSKLVPKDLDSLRCTERQGVGFNGEGYGAVNDGSLDCGGAGGDEFLPPWGLQITVMPAW